MTTHDKAAVGYSIGIAAVAVAIAFYGASEQPASVPTAPIAPPAVTVEPPDEPEPASEPSEEETSIMEETTEETMEETTEETMEETMEETTEETMEETMEEIMEETTEETMEETMEETTEETMEETMEETTEETMEETMEETTEETTEETEMTEETEAEEPMGPTIWEVVNSEGTSVPGCEEDNTCFMPNMLEISVGDTVVWLNQDAAAHTITSGSPATGPDGIFDSSLVMSGATFEHTFEDTGTYEYFCLVHPWMLGTIQVN